MKIFGIPIDMNFPFFTVVLSIISLIYVGITKKWIPRIGIWWNGRKKTSLRTILKIAQHAIHKKELLQFLKWKYKDEPILERCSAIYPVAVYPAHESQIEDVESVLKTPLNQEEPNENEFKADSWAYLNLVKKLGLLSLSNDVDSDTYIIRRLAYDEKVQMECGIGKYMFSYRTCESLEWEIRSRACKLRGSSENAFKSFSKN